MDTRVSRVGGERALLGGLLVVVALLLAASVSSHWYAYRIQVADPGAPVHPLLEVFDVNGERNVPTWFSTLLLAAGAALSGLCAGLARGPLRRAWAAPAVLLLAVSLDEAVSLHERFLDPLGHALLGGRDAGGVLHFAWLLPGVVVLATGAVVAVRLLGPLPTAARRGLAVAAAVWATGAFVMEAVSGVVVSALGPREAYIVVTAAEEGLEMTGAGLAVLAVLRALEATRLAGGALTLALRS